MDDPSSSQTSPTLLGRLRQNPTDQAAWGEFVRRYGPQISAWCRKWGLQEADVQDVTQDVLVKLAEKIREFCYDPNVGRFRAWLKTLTHHARSDFQAARQRPGAGSGDSQVLTLLDNVEAREELTRQLEEAFDHELLQEAIARVKLRVAPRTWEAFRLTAQEGLSGAEAAARLGLKVATVFVHKSEVQRMLREEIRELEGAGPE
jgi:RNA polymerase sigma-70 factor (ECF subfamily)